MSKLYEIFHGKCIVLDTAKKRHYCDSTAKLQRKDTRKNAFAPPSSCRAKAYRRKTGIVAAIVHKDGE